MPAVVIRRWLAHAHQLAMMLALLVVGVWVMDHLTTAGGDDVDDPPAAATTQYHHGNARVFLFLIDSLRFGTATDGVQMPYLASMRQRGAHGLMLSSRDAVTVSAIREMFTGRERFLAFGFVRDFVTGRESVESIFTQLRTAGVSMSVYPPYAFETFADDIPPRTVDLSVGDRDHAQQNAWVEENLARFVSGEADFVVSHIVYSDRVAHDHGIHGQAYKDTFARIDEIIADLDSKIAPDDTLVITGDHGHTDNGRHSLGLEVPSFTLYRGAAFNAGVDMGTVPIVTHRYLMSWAMKQPIAGGYAATRHPDALAAAGDKPAGFNRAVSLADIRSAAASPRKPAWTFWLLAINIGLLAGLGLGLTWGRFEQRRRAIAIVWAGFAALGLMVFSDALLFAPMLMAATLARERRATLTFCAGGALAGAAVHAWGQVLAQQRDWIHEPTWSEMESFAIGAMVAAGVIAYRFGAARAGWLTLAIVGAFGYPTVYRYGMAPALVTMWLAWLVALLVDARHTLKKGIDWPLTLLAAGGVFLLVQPFAFAEAGNFEHAAWRPWADAIMPHGHEAWVSATFWVKLIVFARWNVPHRTKLLGVWAAYEVHEIHWGQWYPSDVEHVSMIALLALAGAVLPPLLDRYGDGDKAVGREVRRVAWLWAMYLTYYYTIRIPNDHYMWADCFLAAIVLSTWLVRRIAKPDALGHHEAIVHLLALVVAGWVTVAWTLHLYEWKMLYTWFPAAFVEEKALFFIPFINGRYVLPVLMARLLIGSTEYPRQLIHSALAVKMGVTVCVLSGVGWVMADSNIYLEAIGQAAQIMVYAVGLL